MVATDGAAENFNSTSEIPAEWWKPKIYRNSPNVRWDGNRANGYTIVEAWSNRGVVNVSMLITNKNETVAQQGEVVAKHSDLAPGTWGVGRPYPVEVTATCGQTADFKSTADVANVFLIQWGPFITGEDVWLAQHSAAQADCPELPTDGGGGDSGGSNPFDGSECVLWGVFVNGVLTSTFWVC